MSKKVKVEGKVITVPDDATPDEIDAIANPKGTTGSSGTYGEGSTPEIRAEPSFPSASWFKQKAYTAADKITNALPAIGGIGGGIVGGTGGTVAGMGVAGVPGAIGGAAVGGMAGESARQLARRGIFPKSKGWDAGVPDTSLEAAKDIGIEGLKQGAYEAGGQGLRTLGKIAAPRLAEAAVAPGKRLLKELPPDVNIGKTILNETTAFRPKTIAKQLEGRIADHSAAEDQALRAAKGQGRTVTINPARKIVADESVIASGKNSPSYLRDVSKVNDQLQYQMGPDGKPLTQIIGGTRPGAGFVPVPVSVPGKQVPVALPGIIDPVRARQIRQGIDTEIGNWATGQDAIKPLQKRVYGSITGEIHRSVPEVIPHDEAMTQLIPAHQAAWDTSFSPDLTKQVVDRFARPTGALISTVAGAGAGAAQGGPIGAAVGGTFGAIAPNAATRPTSLMIGARALNSPFSPTRYIVPIGEGQITKPSAKRRLEDERPDDSEQ